MGLDEVPKTFKVPSTISERSDWNFITLPSVIVKVTPVGISISQSTANLIVKAINHESKRGGQVFYVYNRVQTIQNIVKRLKQMPNLSKIKCAIAHGQLPEKQLADIMHKFYNGEIDVLVCSSIIENGIDLANVNTLIVHNATLFGLGQLYQLKGRIGRGYVQAYAYFFYKTQDLTHKGQLRLQALQAAESLGSGFQLAMQDLEIRGVGNVLGKEHYGFNLGGGTVAGLPAVPGRAIYVGLRASL